MRIEAEALHACSTNVATIEAAAAAAAHNPSNTEVATAPAVTAPTGMTVRTAPGDMITTRAGGAITMIASTGAVIASVTEKPTALPAAVAAETAHWR
jgi:hypothetical protein